MPPFSRSPQSEQGALPIFVIAIVVVVAAVLLMALMGVGKRNNGTGGASFETGGSTAKDTAGSTRPAADGRATARAAANTKRRTDATALLTAVKVFKSQNDNALPGTFRNGSLYGANTDKSVPVTLEHYSGVIFADGDGLPNVADVLVLVLAAECAPGGATREGGNAAAVAQFVIENVDGGLTPQCLSM